MALSALRTLQHPVKSLELPPAGVHCAAGAQKRKHGGVKIVSRSGVMFQTTAGS